VQIGLEETDEITTIRRTTLKLFGVVVTSSVPHLFVPHLFARICSHLFASVPHLL
jgi:hypothetical protein